MNYPHNCFRLNLTFLNEIRRQERIKTLIIDFKTAKIDRVQLDFHGSSLIANRDIYDDTFDTTGDAILIAEPGTIKKYAVEIAGNSYLEDRHGKSVKIAEMKISTPKKHRKCIFCNFLEFAPKQRKFKVAMYSFIYLLHPIHSASYQHGAMSTALVAQCV